MNEFELYVAKFGGNSYLTSKDFPQLLTKVKSDAKVFSSRVEARNALDNYRDRSIADLKDKITKAKLFIDKLTTASKRLSSKKEKQMAELKIKETNKFINNCKKLITKFRTAHSKVDPA